MANNKIKINLDAQDMGVDVCFYGTWDNIFDMYHEQKAEYVEEYYQIDLDRIEMPDPDCPGYTLTGIELLECDFEGFQKHIVDLTVEYAQELLNDHKVKKESFYSPTFYNYSIDHLYLWVEFDRAKLIKQIEASRTKLKTVIEENTPSMGFLGHIEQVDEVLEMLSSDQVEYDAPGLSLIVGHLLKDHYANGSSQTIGEEITAEVLGENQGYEYITIPARLQKILDNHLLQLEKTEQEEAKRNSLV